MAGTPVVAEVPLGRRLERGHVYYVALKALDNDGLSRWELNLTFLSRSYTFILSKNCHKSMICHDVANVGFLLHSGVSNMARFTVPESLSEDSTALHHHAAAGQHVQDPSLEEPLGAGISRETVQRREDNTQLHERTYITPSSRDADTSRVGIEEYNGETREEQRFLSTPPPNSEALESDGPENQENRNRKKNRKRKKNKSKRRKNEGRRNGRRKDLERQGRGRDTSVWGSHLHDIYAEIERWNQS